MIPGSSRGVAAAAGSSFLPGLAGNWPSLQQLLPVGSVIIEPPRPEQLQVKSRAARVQTLLYDAYHGQVRSDRRQSPQALSPCFLARLRSVLSSPRLFQLPWLGSLAGSILAFPLYPAAVASVSGRNGAQGQTGRLDSLPPMLLKGAWLSTAPTGSSLFVSTLDQVTVSWFLSWRAPEGLANELTAKLHNPATAQVHCPLPACHVIQPVPSCLSFQRHFLHNLCHLRVPSLAPCPLMHHLICC